MSDRLRVKDREEARGLVPWVKTQAKEFVDDPLSYAIDKWIYLIFLGLGISIIVGACKGLFKEVWNLF